MSRVAGCMMPDGADPCEAFKDLERQLAEAKAEIDKWKAEAEDNLAGWKSVKAEIEAMRPVVEAAKRIHKIIGTAHNDEAEFTSWSNLDDALREYESRKQP